MAACSPVGGYDCELFVGSVPEELKCRLCKKVAREPSLTTCCGEHFCKLCIEQNVQDKKPCPSCITFEFSYTNDKRDHKKILALEVQCTMKDRGCDWTGTLEQLKPHMDVDSDNCQYVDTECPNECGQPVQKRHLPTHLAKECTKRDFFCQYCNFTDTYEVVCNDHLPQCPYYPIPCPNGCEIMALERGDLDAHLMLCSLEEVECEFSEAGCKVKLVREEMERHLSDNLQRHMLMMNKAVQEKMEQKERKIEELETRLEEKDGQIQELRMDTGRQIREEKEHQRKANKELHEEKDQQIHQLHEEKDQQIRELHEQQIRELHEEKDQQIHELREEIDQQIRELCEERIRRIQELNGRVCTSNGARILYACTVCFMGILLYFVLKHDGLIQREQQRVQEVHMNVTRLAGQLSHHSQEYRTEFQLLETMLKQKIQDIQEERDRQIQELRHELEEKTQKQLELKDEQIRELQKELEKERQIREKKNQELHETINQEQKRQQATNAEVARVEKQLSVHVQEYKERVPFPQFTVTGFQGIKRRKGLWNSPPVYTHLGGHKIGWRVWPNGLGKGTGSRVSVDLCSAKGENDDHLKWPADCTITLQLLNQHRDQDHITVSKRFQWNKPTSTYLGYVATMDIFDAHLIAHKDLDWNADKQTQYLKNDTLQFRIYSVQVHSV